MSWQILSGVNDGYPYHAENAVFPNGLCAPYPSRMMCVDGVTNDGYPYRLKNYAPRPVVTRPQRLHLIRVYAPDETDFSTNGIRILQPLSCTVTEDLNGAFEADLEIPIDPDGDWSAVQRHALLAIPVRRREIISMQLFRVCQFCNTMQADGSMRRTAYLRSIFYDLNDVLLDDTRPTDLDAHHAIRWVMEHPYTSISAPDTVASRFETYSDIDKINTAYYMGISVTAALIGEDNCILNRWGGELYRDNYYFSICSRREGSRDNCFDIAYGVDMTEIEEDIDYSDYASHLVADCNLFPRITMTYYNPAVSKPHHTVRYVRFNYDTATLEQYREDVASYFDTIKYPSVNYRVSFANLRNQPLYEGFLGLQHCEVGDTGTITNRAIDISTTQQIIKRVYDPLTDTVVSVELGNTRGSITKKSVYSNTITSGQSPIEKQLAAAEIAGLGTWNDARRLRWYQIEKYTWNQAKNQAKGE